MLNNNDDFVCALLRIFDPLDAPDGLERALRRGATRAEITTLVLRRQAVVEGFGALAPDLSDFRSEREVAAALAELRGASDREFVAGAHRIIIGREAEEDALGRAVERLAHGRARSSLVRDLARSHEAALRGFSEPVAHRLADGVGPRARSSA
jgi:hypothetical protein